MLKVPCSGLASHLISSHQERDQDTDQVVAEDEGIFGCGFGLVKWTGSYIWMLIQKTEEQKLIALSTKK